MTTISKRTRNVIRGLIVLTLLTGWFTAPRVFRHWVEPTALAAPMTFVVNTAADADDGLCSTATSGCTLREAINAANANSGPDTINFNIPGAGVKTIKLISNLPDLTSPVTIDGYTQGLATPNTLATGNNAVLLIELNGTAMDISVGLRVTAGDCIIRGLIINNFGDGIDLGGGNNTVAGCFIGTNEFGNSAGGSTGGKSNVDGVVMFSGNNTLGGTTPAARNVISGNSKGVVLFNSAATGNKVQGNHIGTNASGTSPVSNREGVIFFSDASDNTIGGTTVSSSNLIAFNDRNGISFVATPATGNAILGNSIHSNARLGINLGQEGVTTNDIGDGDTGANNLQNFPVLTQASDAAGVTTVQGIFNSTANTQFRAEFFSSPSCDASGNGEGKKFVGFTFLTTDANGNAPISVNLPSASLDGPYITATATDPSNNTSEFSNCVTALGLSLTVNSTADTDDGSCTLAAGGCTLREAINAANSNADANTIKFNIPGSGVRTITPLSPLPFIEKPVIVDGYTQPGASPNTIVEGNDANLLIELNGSSVANAAALTCFVGSCVLRGLIVNRFSSASFGALSLLSGNNVVAGNFIGTDSTGTTGLGNVIGVIITNGSDANRIGGLTPADRNVISGNTQEGVRITSSDANVVWGNYIGTNASGTAAIGNAIGVNLNSHFYNSIGGTVSGSGNVISGNSVGVEMGGSSGMNNKVQGNYIGTDASGTKNLGNSGTGVVIGALQSVSNNIIGDDILNGEQFGGGGNLIAFNGGDGVSVAQGTGNVIFGNEIHSNAGLGIDLAPDGVTANDAGDGDSGADNLQNFPILTAATVINNKIQISYTLNSKPNTKFVVALFSSSTCDPTGNGEGEKVVGIEPPVTTDASGKVSSTAFPFTASIGGTFITAIATDPAGNTSEFSPCLQAPFTSTFQFGLSIYSVVEDCTEVIVDVSRTGDTSVAASVDYASQSGTASDRTDFTTAVGTLHFAPGETAMSFSVPISEDSFIEGTETATLTLSNAVGAGLGSPATATLEITDDQPEQSNNPVDVAEQFVCQHYQDFLNREHDVAGLNFWTNEIESCGADAECRAVKRINVSAAFFLSIEFQETGGDVIRTQRAAFGKKSDSAASRLTYLQFLRDARQVGNGVIVGEPGWEQTLEDNKQAYALQVVTSSQFVAQYPLNQNPDTYVDALFASAGVAPTASERQEAINAFGAGGIAGRTAALRKVADSQTLREAEFRPAFVLMQYFGYLRRNPTDPPDSNDNGYQFWLAKLNAFNGDYVNAEMVKAFIVSTEFRSRFGAP